MSVDTIISAGNSFKQIGLTRDDRALYNTVTPNGEVVASWSIPKDKVDVFEKSYKDIMEITPKINEYNEKYSTEEAKKRRKITSWGVFSAISIVGSCLTGYLAKNLSGAKKALAYTGGVAASIAAGTIFALKCFMPPCTIKTVRTMQNLQGVFGQLRMETIPQQGK